MHFSSYFYGNFSSLFMLDNLARGIIISSLCSRLPWWIYIKLAIVGCLVTPHFDGSFYVYKHIVHPCFSMALHSVMNRLIKLKWFFKQDMLVIEVKRDAKETETEALDNLIDFKVCHPWILFLSLRNLPLI